MRTSTRFALIGLLLFGACDSGDTAVDGPDATPLPDITDEFDDATVYIWGTTIPFVPGSFTFQGMAGVKVCIDSHPEIPCAVSDETGSYRIDGVPADTEITMVASKQGWVSGATQTRTVLANSQSISLFVTDEVGTAALVRPVGYDYPFDGVGAVTFRFRDFATGGLRDAVITASSGDVIYTQRGGIPDPTLTAARRGDGYIFDVSPGEITIDIDAPGFRCNLGDMQAYPGDGPNQLRAIVHANMFTTVSAVCSAD